MYFPGLPNALGEYDETPEIMASHLKVKYYTQCQNVIQEI